MYRLSLAALLIVVTFAGCSVSSNDEAANAEDINSDTENSAPVGENEVSGTTSSSSTSTTTLPGTIVNQYELTVDDCFDQVEEIDAGRSRTITTRVDCDIPHGLQIYDQLSYPAGPGEAFPGVDVVEDYALAACYRRFEQWTGSAYETSLLEIGVIVPNRENFEGPGYRGIHCHVRHDDGELIVGTARGRGL